MQDTFDNIAKDWDLCYPSTIYPRWERCRVLAKTPAQHNLVKRMYDKFIAGIIFERNRMTKNGQSTEQHDIILQIGHEDRYNGPLLHGRFQIMGSLTPGSYYLVDHTLDDLIYRERNSGRNGEVMRFATIAEVEKIIGQIIGQPVIAQPVPGIPPGKDQRNTTVARKAATPAPAPASEPVVSGRNSASALFRSLIMEGRLTDDQIFAEVQKTFGLDDSKRKYVAWYRNDMRKNGHSAPDPVGGSAPRGPRGGLSEEHKAAMQAGRERKKAEKAAAEAAAAAEAERAAKKAAREAKKAGNPAATAIVENARTAAKATRKVA